MRGVFWKTECIVFWLALVQASWVFAPFTQFMVVLAIGSA